jgi:hypothetical protein
MLTQPGSTALAQDLICELDLRFSSRTGSMAVQALVWLIWLD